tara:strand:- start:554 stop:1219 length:666 start_codon:yes stop_codon:yes gene_type:complete
LKKRNKIITIAIDSPAAAGAGTQSKLIAKEYNLLYLDTGKIYRYIGKLKLESKIFNYKVVKEKINNLKLKDLNKKNLLSDHIAKSASIIAKDKKIRKIVTQFQKNCAYNPPRRFSGSVLDGRDITSVIMKDAMIKLYITASLGVRAKRRFLEFKKFGKKLSYNSVLKSLRNRDNLDKNRTYSPLKKTKDSILINTSKLSKKACFYKIKSIIDKKLKINGIL